MRRAGCRTTIRAGRVPEKVGYWVTAGLLLLLGLPVAAQTTPPGYTLHPGDKLIVGVYDDPKLLPQEINVTPDGSIAFPMVGDVMVGGKTTGQVRSELEAKLKKYISEPIAIVMVTEVKGNVAYVVGQVNKPGQLVMNPSINVLQALSMAGGGNPYAKLDSIIVIRTSAGGVQRVLPFKYGQVTAGKDLQQNIMLESGDVVVVP
ncbi:MAG: polysaccharide export protein [Pseudomonadota bacterium]|nr:polysaccharide export protein [Pseudomonadota bacterium]